MAKINFYVLKQPVYCKVANKPGSRKIQKVLTWTVMILIAGILTIYGLISVKKRFASIEEMQTIKFEMIERVQFDYFGDTYLEKETPGYLIEIFPYGKTDDQEYQAEGIRLMKTTWYNKDRTRISSIEYQIVPYKY